MNELTIIKPKRKEKYIINSILIFMFSAFLGWAIEVGYVYIVTGNWVHRGICYGPICSIYGVAALILYNVYGTPKRNIKEILFTFLSSSIILGFFELVSGLFFKYVLNIEMWNYRGQFLEIFDYTTVPIAMGWGIFACIYLFLIQPLFLKIIDFFPKHAIKKLAYILLTLYFIDFSISIFNIAHNPEVLYRLVNPFLK